MQCVKCVAVLVTCIVLMHTTDSNPGFCSLVTIQGCKCTNETHSSINVSCYQIGLTSLPPLDFGPGPIHTLNFECNKLKTVRTGDFFGLHVTRLLLSNNTISELNDLAFWGLEYHLRTLDLSWNRLARMPAQALLLLRELHNLHLTGNRIRILQSECLLPLENLEVLYMDQNPLMQIEPSAFRGTHLSMLILNQVNLTHGIHSIPTMDLSRLRGLSLASNDMSTLTKEWFNDLSSLRYLNLDDNILTRIPGDVFSGVARTLTTLELNSNRFTRVPRQSIRKLSQLQSLHLRDNQISKVHARSFNESRMLVTLDLSHNHISDLSSRAFLGLKSVAKLDLRHNALLTLDEKTFSYLNASNTRRIYLSSNPWLCNCLLKWLRRDYKKQTEMVRSIVDMRAVRCTRPDFLLGKPLIRISTKTLTCDHDYYYYYDDDDYPI